MYDCFGLVLMVTHACNLRCRYCYTGAKWPRLMPVPVGLAAIDRAARSVRLGGRLEIGFFGGEPLLEPDLVRQFMVHARRQANARQLQLRFQLTTNGTITDTFAWSVLNMPDVDVSVSHDGLPEVHDRYRRSADGAGTSSRVLATIHRLLAAGRDFRVVMVVRPDTVCHLAAGIRFLREQGVRHVVPALDLWATWSPADAGQLRAVLADCAELWLSGLPGCSVAWFDEKAGQLAGVPVEGTARCGFGDGTLAVAPSGNLYPCERLIGDDGSGNAMRLPGHALDGAEFAPLPPPPRTGGPCAECRIQSQCSTYCRCGNYVRTGDINRPDGLLCLLDRALVRETMRVLRTLEKPDMVCA
jgi:uncharacterized protein